MHVFGGQAYILTSKEKRLKWDPEAQVGIFIGYEEATKAYRVFDVESGQIMISRDVTFDETKFEFLMDRSSEEVNDAAIDLDLLKTNEDDVCQTVYKQSGKRKNRLGNDALRSTQYPTGLEYASASEDSLNRRPKCQSSAHEIMTEDEERKQAPTTR